jgi:hypothetical protein
MEAGVKVTGEHRQKPWLRRIVEHRTGFLSNPGRMPVPAGRPWFEQVEGCDAHGAGYDHRSSRWRTWRRIWRAPCRNGAIR